MAEDDEQSPIDKAKDWVKDNPEKATFALVGSGGLLFLALVTR